RQHYLKFRLPDTYRQLIAAGTKEEYSMDYATHNGFRAGTSRSFLWFDLLQNEVSGLRVHPFVFMDATAWFYQQYNLTEAFSEWERLYLAVGKNGGTFISIWHNHLLGWDKSGRKQQALLEQTLNYVQSPA